MRELTIQGITLHFARTEKEWKKEIDKRYDYDTLNKSYHHVVERDEAPILKLCIENGVKIPMGIHLMQKSTDMERRIRFQKIIREMVEKDVWNVLQTIKKYSRLDPRCRKLVGEQMNA